MRPATLRPDRDRATRPVRPATCDPTGVATRPVRPDRRPGLQPEPLCQPGQVKLEAGSAFGPFGGISTGIGGPATAHAGQPAAVADDFAPGADQHSGQIAKVIQIPIEGVTLSLPCPAVVVHAVGVLGDPVELTVPYQWLAAYQAVARLC
ncbi:MAG: hypothetical protein DRI90_15735 [Deltaproteobacteria bacterium]|nr:MAG: hypothetical protein DRI90_15735 [Deltaproteobacteria bacterium]